MANVVSQPVDGATLNECMTWVVTGNYVEAPNKSVIVYQLCKDGTPITDICAVDVCSPNEEIPLNFQNEIECSLRTNPPDCSNPNAVVQAPDATGKFSLKLGEFEINNDECEDNPEPIILKEQLGGAAGQEVTILNSYCNPWDELIWPYNHSEMVMTSQPVNCPIRVCPCTKNWLYVYGAVTVRANIKLNNGINLGVDQFLGFGTSGEVTMIPIGICQVSDITGIPQSAIQSIKIIPSTYGTDGILFVKDRCCCKKECRYALYGLEPKGGISSVGADCIKRTEVERTGKTICITPDCFKTEQENALEAGNKFIVDNAVLKVTAEINRRIKPQEIAFMNGIGASGQWYAPIPGTEVLAGFIGSPGVTFEKGRKTYEISGAFSLPIKSHSTN